MAHWVLLGDRKLNMDLICALRKVGENVFVVFSGLNEEQTTAHFEFKGEDARKLWNACRDAARLE